MEEAFSILARPLFLHLYIILGMLAGLAAARHLFIKQAEKNIEEWAKDLGLREETATTEPPETPLTRKRIQEQLGEIRLRAEHHIDVMAFFYARYYMAVILLSVSGAVAAVVLIFITNAGWSDASPYLRTLFIAATVASAWYGAIPRLFRHERNIAENKKLYLSYTALKNEVISYLVTGATVSGEAMEEAAFIGYVDRRLATYNNVAIGFDQRAAPDFATGLRPLK